MQRKPKKNKAENASDLQKTGTAIYAIYKKIFLLKN